eukprot:6184039-Pleurochrysis_carterae.AAC.1
MVWKAAVLAPYVTDSLTATPQSRLTKRLKNNMPRVDAPVPDSSVSCDADDTCRRAGARTFPRDIA